MLKTVLQLVRFPGIFTAFSNVLVGFFLASEGNLELTELPFLLTTTGLLFSGGMMMNDYVDHKTDLIERPKRPLPSKKISREKTLFFIISYIASVTQQRMIMVKKDILAKEIH